MRYVRSIYLTVGDLYKATTIEDKLHYALQVIELITCEEGLEARNMQILRNNAKAKEVQDEHIRKNSKDTQS